MLRTRPLLAAAAALLVTTVAGSAAAGVAQATIYEAEYEVDLELTATYTHRYFMEKFNPEYQKETIVDGGATVRATLTHVLFRDGKLMTPRRFASAEQTTHGTATASDRWWDAVNQRTVRRSVNCAAGSVDNPGTAELVDGGHGVDGQSFRVRFAQVLPLGFDQCVGEAPVPDALDLGGLMSYKKPVGEAMLDAAFTLPGETIGMGQITQLFQAQAFQKTPAFCPDKRASDIENTQACAFDWQAKVTFRKVAENHFYEEWPDDVPRGDQPPRPTPPTPSAPGATGGTSGGAGSTSGPAIPTGGPAGGAAGGTGPGGAGRVVAPKRVVVHPSGRKLSFAVVCPRGCTGTAQLRGARGTLATRRFTTKPGARTVTIPLAKRHLGRARTVVVTLRPAGAKAVTTTIALTR